MGSLRHEMARNGGKARILRRIARFGLLPVAPVRILGRPFAFLALLWASLLVGLGTAQATEPQPWQLGLQQSGSTVEDRIQRLNDVLLIIISLIVAFVMVLLGYAIWRFRESKNPVPSRTSHNTFVEIAWTVVPVILLAIIAFPSLRLLFFMDRTAQADMTLKVTGVQWYWKYEYPDSKIGFDSYLVPANQLKAGQRRLLEVDNPVVLPVNTNVRIEIAGSDVMHSWFVPSLGIQKYAVPGRLNETWVNIKAPGLYYGECNQICGVNHAFMPIVVQAMSKADYAQWLTQAKVKFASADNGSSAVAVSAGPGAAPATERAPAAGGSVQLAAVPADARTTTGAP